MTDQTAVWIDGDPLMEAIAADVWEQCGRSDSGMCVEDDPRNIAAVAAAAVARARADSPVPATDRVALRDRIAAAIRSAACSGDCEETEEACVSKRVQAAVWHRGVLAEVLGTPEVFADAALAVLPAPADRAAMLREEAALIRAHCPDHLDSNSAEGSWINCHCDVADDMDRRLAANSTSVATPDASANETAAFVATSDRAAVLREAADAVATVRDTTDVNVAVYPRYDARQRSALSDAENRLRRMADEASGEAKPWLSDSARIGRALIWSWTDIGKGAFGEGYRAAQAEARALLGGQRGTDATPPAVGTPEPKEEA